MTFLQFHISAAETQTFYSLHWTWMQTKYSLWRLSPIFLYSVLCILQLYLLRGLGLYIIYRCLLITFCQETKFTNPPLHVQYAEKTDDAGPLPDRWLVKTIQPAVVRQRCHRVLVFCAWFDLALHRNVSRTRIKFYNFQIKHKTVLEYTVAFHLVDFSQASMVIIGAAYNK